MTRRQSAIALGLWGGSAAGGAAQFGLVLAGARLSYQSQLLLTTIPVINFVGIWFLIKFIRMQSAELNKQRTLLTRLLRLPVRPSRITSARVPRQTQR